MAKDKKERILNNNFSFDGSQNEYGFKLKKKHRPWWLLLLLLPLLLLIPLKKDITVMTKVDGNPEPFVDVSMSYTGRYLLWDWHFLVDRPFDTIQQTDAEGVTVFKDLGYSVYSYIFRCKEPITFMAGGECFEDKEETFRFHKVRKVTLDMDPRTADVRLKVVDSELGFEIPGAMVEVEFDGRGGREVLADSTDAAGCVVIKGARLCGGFSSIKASADGYADTLLVDMTVEELLKEAGGYPIPLRPLKDRFTFFVKNKYTKQPVPDALAEVTLTLNGKIGSVGKSRTNVDGLGQGFFDDARVLAKVDIKASKRPHYKDGRFVSPTGKELMVREFKALPDSLRVVWLEPEPYSVDFRNVDTLTGKPIPGVRNEILVEGIDGTTRRSVETSNRNGYFPVKAVAGDKVTIVSTLDPYYHPKTTVVGKFEKGGTIYMRPVQVTLKFRTVEEDQGVITGILPDCNLVVTVDGKRVDPTNSGTGEFEVPNLLLTSTISIEASKSGYGSNNTKVNNRSVEYLWKADQNERDIPLKKSTEPQPPTKNCGVHFSGLVLSDEESEVGISVIFQYDKGGEYVGSGNYPDNQRAFPNAVSHTFDAIAVDNGTHLILYSKPNFNGTVLLDVVGPMLITNVLWINDSRYNGVATKTFTPELQELFPVSRRRWSSSNMHDWSNGSCKIICGE